MIPRIGKYKVVRLLGKGATASLYLANDAFAGRVVAVKVLDAMPAEQEEARRQLKFFQNEASLAGKLRHPHIVSIFDAGVEKTDEGELPYLVMEVVDGTSLQPHCEPSALLPVSRTAQLARSDTTQVAGVGSPAYMSPEQIRGGEEIDFRSDMFSLGGVMYHMLTGVRPSSGTTAWELMESILDKAPPAPSAVAPGVPPALDHIVLRALGKTREERFESWDAFAGALEPFLSEDDATLSALSDVEEFSAMRRLDFFRHFTDNELWEVVRRCRVRKFTAGTELIREGVEDDRIFVLAAGLLKVAQRGKLLNAVSPGACVGEMVYARRGSSPRSATVTAVEMSWALTLGVADIASFSDSCRARFSEAFLSVMADRLSMLGGRLVALMQEQKVGLV